MEKFIRFYNQNRREIYKWVTIIAVAYLFLRIINSIIEEQSKENMLEYAENIVNEKSLDNEVVLNNTTSSNKIAKKYGNELKIGAGNVVDKEYNTEQKFIENFINIFFKDDSKYVIQELGKYYVIEIYNSNLIETGNINEVSRKYITIQNKKINIQDYITISEINKKASNDNIELNIKKVTYYYDYAEYKVYIPIQKMKILIFKIHICN